MLSFFLALFHLLNYLNGKIVCWKICLNAHHPTHTYTHDDTTLKLVFLDDSWEMKEKLFGRKNFSLVDFQERFFWMFAIDEGARRKADGKTFFCSTLCLYSGFLSHLSIIIWFINFVSAATNTTYALFFFTSDHTSPSGKIKLNFSYTQLQNNTM